VFKSGFIAIAGRPNVGKSTLLNAIVGEKLAITSSKPQTTRNRITGIRNTGDGQFIFLDTPGIHHAKTPLNRYMVRAATSAFGEVDLILFLVEADRGYDPGDGLIIESPCSRGPLKRLSGSVSTGLSARSAGPMRCRSGWCGMRSCRGWPPTVTRSCGGR